MSVAVSNPLTNRSSNTRIQRNSKSNFTQRLGASCANVPPNFNKTPWYKGGKCNRQQNNTLMPLDCVQDHALPSLRGSSCIKVPGKEIKEVIPLKQSSRIPVLYTLKRIPTDSGLRTPGFFASVLCSVSPATELNAKLPVLKKPSKLAPIQSGEAEGNTSRIRNLSAAARRQKFHQSRHPILSEINLPASCHISNATTLLKNLYCEPSVQQKPVSVFSTRKVSPLKSKIRNSHIQEHRDAPAEQIERFPSEASEPVIRIVASQREVLPPVLPAIEKSVAKAGNQLSKKRKNLLGEITHFPAICNILPSKTGKIISVNTVPALPPILPPPPAPPPSISASLEQESINKNPLHELKMESPINKYLLKEEDTISKQLSDAAEENLLSSSVIPNCKHSPFLHTVSIVVHPVDFEIDANFAMESANNVLSDTAIKSETCNSTAKTVMDLAELRRKEFARLLDEHAQIVREIQRAETGKI